MVLSCWLLTLLCAAPQAVIFRVLKHPTKEFYQCTTIDFFEDLAEERVNTETNRTEHFLLGINTESWHSMYHCLVNTEILFLPLTIIIISYWRIFNIIYVSVLRDSPVLLIELVPTTHTAFKETKNFSISMDYVCT